MIWSVEILRLGSITRRVIDTKISDRFLLMIVADGGSIYDQYISKLKSQRRNNWDFINTTKDIIGGSHVGRFSRESINVIGEIHQLPEVGKSFRVGSWQSSVVDYIIDNDIVVTKNSIYALHNQSKLRDKKLSNLGL